MVVVAVLALANLGGAAGLGVSSAVFFVLCAAALGTLAQAVVRQQSWARAPIVLVELIELGLAWNARDANTTLAVALAAVSVVVLVALLHPATTRALAPHDD